MINNTAHAKDFLKEFITLEDDDDPSSVWFDDAVGALVAYASQFTPAPIGEWISVEDRLPEKGQTVLACLEGDVTKRIVYYVLKRVAEKNVTWRAADDNSEVSCAFNVTHWQPLPTPPKTEGQ